MASIVYILCGMLSIGCAWMLFRAYRRSHSRLLLWSTVCFFCLAINNIILFFDRVVTGPAVDLSVYRGIASLVGLSFLVYGLVWDAA